MRMFLLGAAALLACLSPASAQSPAADHDFRTIVRQAADAVFPAVIYVKVVRSGFERGEQKAQEVSGSGVIISADGEALTNWHVVEQAVEVRCLLADGRHFVADVLGSDKDTDLALLKLRLGDAPADLPVAPIGDSDLLREGDFVMAMGAPWGLNRSVSIGIISCTRRYLPLASEYSHWLQTDAAISPGNSGGPLVNTSGEIVGLNTRGVFFGGDTGFTVPSSVIRGLIPELRKGHIGWSWTGLQLQALRDFDKNVYFDADEGVVIAGSDENSPARAAGFLQRDLLLSVNGKALTAATEEELPDVRRALALLPVDSPAEFLIDRGGEQVAITLTPRVKGQVEGDSLDCPRWDLTARQINRFNNPDLHFHRPDGVFVFGIRFPGNSARSGLARNDIILSIDGAEIRTLDDLRAAHERSLAALPEKNRIVLSVLRSGLARQVVLDITRDFRRE